MRIVCIVIFVILLFLIHSSNLSAGIASNAADRANARVLIDFLASPSAYAVIRRTGLEPAMERVLMR